MNSWIWLFLFLCWSVFMQQIWIFLIFISFSIKKNRSATCQICYLPLLFYCFRRKHRYQSRSHYRVIKPNYDRNSCRLLPSLVQSGHHHHFIEYNLFSPWYSWKIAHLALNNNHSLTYSSKVPTDMWLFTSLTLQ
jgi:hypothetical protein